jgi:hypothetical protein
MREATRKVESQKDTNLSGFSDSMLRDCTFIIFRKKIFVQIGNIYDFIHFKVFCLL